MECKIRTSEGQLGNLMVYVVPKGDVNTCQALEVDMKPLNLHEHVDSFDKDLLEQLPLSRLLLKGSFSMDDGLNWIGNCLPDVPTHVQDESKPHILSFKSCFVGTIVIVELNHGSLQVTSDNLSVITIIKDQVSQVSNAKKITLEVEADIFDASW